MQILTKSITFHEYSFYIAANQALDEQKKKRGRYSAGTQPPFQLVTTVRWQGHSDSFFWLENLFLNKEWLFH